MISARPFAGRTRALALRPAFTMGGSLLLAQGLTGFVGFVSARALGPAAKGQVTAVVAWSQMLVFVFLLGLSFSLSVRTAESRGCSLGIVLGNAIAFSAAVSLVVGGTASVVLSWALRNLGPNTALYVRWGMFGGSLTMGGELLASIHMALGRNRRYSIFRLALPITSAVVVIPVWLIARLTTGWVLAGFVLGAVAALIVVCIGLPWQSIEFDLRTLILDVRYGLKSHVASLVSAVNLRLDLLIMSLFLSATAVGLYGLANSVMVVLTAVPAAGGMLLLRSVAWNSEEGPSRTSQLHQIRRGARRYFQLTAALGVGVFVFSPVMIHLLLGPSYGPSVRLIQILTPGYVARAYVVLATLGAVGARRPWIGNVSEGAALVVTATLLALLLRRYGATGAAITSTCAYATAAVVSWFALRRAQRGID